MGEENTEPTKELKSKKEVRRHKYMSRKLTVFIVNDLVLTGFMALSLFIDATILTTAVLISFMSLIVLNGITYIGGKALEVWAKSKYFHSELLGK